MKKISVIFSQHNNFVERHEHLQFPKYERAFNIHSTKLDTNFKAIECEGNDVAKICGEITHRFFEQLSEYKALYHKNAEQHIEHRAKNHSWAKKNASEIIANNEHNKKVFNAFLLAKTKLKSINNFERLLRFYSNRCKNTNIYFNGIEYVYDIESPIKDNHKELYGKGIGMNLKWYASICIDGVNVQSHRFINEQPHFFLNSLDVQSKKDFATKFFNYVKVVNKALSM